MGAPAIAKQPGLLSHLGAITVRAAVELGRTELLLRDLAALGSGSIIRLDRLVDEPVDLTINGRPFARGQIVIVDNHLGLRITELTPSAS